MVGRGRTQVAWQGLAGWFDRWAALGVCSATANQPVTCGAAPDSAGRSASPEKLGSESQFRRTLNGEGGAASVAFEGHFLDNGVKALEICALRE